jgi:hypothetical protein
MTEEGNSLAVAKELQAGAMMVSVEKNTDAKDTIEGSTTAEGPQELPAGALLSRFRHLSVSPRPRDSTPKHLSPRYFPAKSRWHTHSCRT